MKIYCSIKRDLYSKFIDELIKRYIWIDFNKLIFHSLLNEIIYIEIIPRYNFRIVSKEDFEQNIEPKSEITTNEELEIFVENLSNHFDETPIELFLGTNIQDSRISIYWNKILFKNKEFETELNIYDLENISQISSSIIMDSSNKLVLNTISKHVFYYDGYPCGTLLLDDLKTIILLHNCLAEEHFQFDVNEYPNFEDLFKQIEEYIIKTELLFPKNLSVYLSLFKKQL